MGIECERKYCNVDFVALRKCLRKAGAVYKGVHFEHNSLWDTPESTLRHTDRLLRLRTQTWAHHVRYILTLKLNAEDIKACKIREERELALADGAMMESVLLGLGYTRTLCYEKIREVWHCLQVEVVLDHLPFADVIELEGTVEEINYCAQILALDSACATTDNYHALHAAWRKAHGLPPQLDFVFTAQERESLLKNLQKEEDVCPMHPVKNAE